MGRKFLSVHRLCQEDKAMARSICTVACIGNVGENPQPIGDSGARFSVATTQRDKERETGEWIEKTNWWSVTAWGKLATEVVLKYLKKGDKVFCQGDFGTFESEGGKLYLNLNCKDFQILTAKSERNLSVSDVAEKIDGQVLSGGDDDDLPF
jgi:single stranded DNA-binding protein